MRRDQFEHVIAAAAQVTDEDVMVVIGSQAILGPHPDAPDTLLRSIEVDLYPLHDPGKADAVEGALGDGSPFAQTYGYYAHGVGPETAKAPRGWQDRLITVAIPPRVRSPRRPVALCLEPHDLVLAKLVAGRDHDRAFARDALDGGIVRREILLDRVPGLPIDAARQAAIEDFLRRQDR